MTEEIFTREQVKRATVEAGIQADISQRTQILYLYDITEDGFSYVIVDQQDALPDVVTAPYVQFIAKPHYN